MTARMGATSTFAAQGGTVASKSKRKAPSERAAMRET